MKRTVGVEADASKTQRIVQGRVFAADPLVSIEKRLYEPGIGVSVLSALSQRLSRDLKRATSR
jgi:hypothetical protein